MKLSSYVKTLVTFMVHIRRPLVTHVAESIFEVVPSEIDKNIKLIIFDFDDTLSFHLGEISERTEKYLTKLQNKGYKLAVYSNSGIERTKFLNDHLERFNIYNVERSDKPLPDGYREVMDNFEIKPEHSIMIGDRIGSDMLGAYRAGIKHRVLVEDFSKVFGGQKAPVFYYVYKNLERLLYKLIGQKATQL